MLEKTIEAKVVAYAKLKGCMVRKMNGQGFRGWPDRLFISSRGTFWIEFKRPGNGLDPVQQAIIGELTHLGQSVYVCDDVGKGKSMIDAELSK